MPENEDRAPAAGAGDAGALRSTIRLVDELVDALVGQVRRAKRQGETATGLPRGTKKALKELADDAASIEGSSAELLEALGADTTGAKPPPPPVTDTSAGEEEAGSSSDEIVRSLAIDLRLQGHSRDEVRERLEETFGADQAAGVIDEVFDG